MRRKNILKLEVTVISNDFIDRHMASANGEYIKEYLFLLRHEGEEITIPMIADALNHTESDVNRALAYWERAGVLSSGEEVRSDLSSGTIITDEGESAASVITQEKISACDSSVMGCQPVSSSGASFSADRMTGLAGDEDFSQLLYIAQKYMNKVFTQRECEIFAYLYDGLHMPAELLEYVVEYCVQAGHTSIRYIETVAINWHETGIKTVDEAKKHSSSFSKDTFAVMKAFGLNDRKPGDAEKEMIDRWFKTLGFTKELVLEACARTLESTHSPSFRYADKILTEWKKAGVRILDDVKKLDLRFADAKGKNQTKRSPNLSNHTNQFHNFQQRETDYDALILQQLKE